MIKVVIGGVAVVVSAYFGLALIGLALHIILGSLIPLAVGVAGGAYLTHRLDAPRRRSVGGGSRSSLPY